VSSISGIGSSLNSLYSNQLNLLQSANQLSSGNRITSAAVDPSGLAIFNALESQAAGFDQGSANAQDALNATNVAEGGAQSITGILGSLNTESIEASNGLLSPTDSQALQAQATQQIQQINTIAQNTNFNGVQLLTGQFSGGQAAAPASSAVTNNDILLSSGSNVVNTGAGITTPATTPGESIQISVSAGQAQVNLVDNATGNVTNVGSFASGSSVTAGGVTFTLGNFSASDTGSATIAVTGAQSFSAGSSLTVQTGASSGATTSLNFSNLTSSSLGVSNLDFGTTANAEDSIGVIGNALNSVLSAQAQLGAQATSLQNQINNNNIASTNLTASASSIGDTNVPNTVNSFNHSVTQNLLTLDVLRTTNANQGYLTGLLNSAA
jgi:flagellin